MTTHILGAGKSSFEQYMTNQNFLKKVQLVTSVKQKVPFGVIMSGTLMRGIRLIKERSEK